ncbi:MAG: hypothetical protein KJO32_17255 [Deltaproteobacteria bacterium]|nr:hypothetical protein [Deltaproteobacteria bacterium]
MKKVFVAILALTCVICIGIISVEFHATGAFADDVDFGKHKNEYIKLETKAKLDIATRFNVEIEYIDCEAIFSKPSFGKAYHKSGSVQEYRRATKPDVLPDYQLRRTDYQNGSGNPARSIVAVVILCSLLLVVVLIIWGGSLFFRNGSKPDFKHCNEV